MTEVDMSPEAVARRLEALDQLSRAAVTLSRIGGAEGLQRPLAPREREIVDRCAGRHLPRPGAGGPRK